MAIDMGCGWIPIDAEGYHLEWSRSWGSYPRNLMGRCHLALEMTCLVLSRAVLCLFLLANCKKMLPTTYTISILYYIYIYIYIMYIYIYMYIITIVHTMAGWYYQYHCVIIAWFNVTILAAGPGRVWVSWYDAWHLQHYQLGSGCQTPIVWLLQGIVLL